MSADQIIAGAHLAVEGVGWLCLGCVAIFLMLAAFAPEREG